MRLAKTHKQICTDLVENVSYSACAEAIKYQATWISMGTDFTINAHITFWKRQEQNRERKKRMVTISHCTHNRTDTSFTNIWNSISKPTPNKSQNENMNNEKQMVFSKQNFNQALVAVKTQKHVN